MPRIWRIMPHDESQIRQLSSELRVEPLVAQVLLARGYRTGASAAEFLDAKLLDLHEPELLPGVSEAADRIVSAMQAKRRITVYGDYDVDGMTSTSILWHCLQLAGADVDYYIPCRLEEGYGLNSDALRQLHEEDPSRLLITVDCGIASVAEADVADELGLELIVTDHHEMGEVLPKAACLVHPRLPGSTYPFTELCGAGVAFKLAWAICQRLGDGKKASPRMKEFLLDAMGLAAIGTVADVVPLVGENRVIVRYGLSSLVGRANPGLAALLKVAGIDRNKELQSEDIGFAIGPRLNAAGRLGQARLAVELLTTDDGDRAKQLAIYLDELNKNRQTVERRIMKQAKEMVAEHPDWEEQPALVLAHRDWHAGVIGIVANRIAEHFEKPTILISLKHHEQIGTGSGRSFAGFNLHAGLSACAEHLEGFGGHAVAAGLKIRSDRIDDFRDSFCQFVTENQSDETQESELHIDAEVRLADLTHKAVHQLDRLGPFGCQNERPVMAATRVELAEEPRRIGGGERHLSLMLRHYGKTMRAVAFGRGDWADNLAAQNGPLAVSFKPGINRFRGQESVELQLIDWQPDSCVSTKETAQVATQEATAPSRGD